MTALAFKVEGLKELVDQLKEFGDEIAQRKGLRAAARKAFAPVLEEAQRLVPYETGDLHDSIKMSAALPKQGETVVAIGLVMGKPAGWRWHFAEFGTRHNSAKPFLRPAIESKQGEVLDTLKVELQKAIKRAIRKRTKAKKGRAR